MQLQFLWYALVYVSVIYNIWLHEKKTGTKAFITWRLLIQLCPHLTIHPWCKQRKRSRWQLRMNEKCTVALLVSVEQQADKGVVFWLGDNFLWLSSILLIEFFSVAAVHAPIMLHFISLNCIMLNERAAEGECSHTTHEGGFQCAAL